MHLFHRDFGTGPRPALALHCGLGQSGHWKGIAAALDDLSTLRAVDLPGHGRSPDWDGVGDLTEISCAAVLDVLDAWQADRPVDLFGHSYGGVIALMLAQRHPDRVRSLTMIEPVLMRALPNVDYAAQIDRMRPCADMVAAGDTHGAARLFLGLFGGDADFDRLPAQIQSAIAARIHLVIASHPVVEDDRPGLTTPKALAALTLPVLLIEGTTSLNIHSKINASLAERLPNARRAVIAGAGHMVPETHPVAVAAELRAFLSGT